MQKLRGLAITGTSRQLDSLRAFADLPTFQSEAASLVVVPTLSTPTHHAFMLSTWYIWPMVKKKIVLGCKLTSSDAVSHAIFYSTIA